MRGWTTAVVLALVLAGCASDDKEPADVAGPAETTSTETTTSSEAPTTEATSTTQPETTTTAPSDCTPADQRDIDAITAGLTGGATSIGEAFQVQGDGYRYIGANIYDDTGEKVSSADVWVFDGTTAYSLSGSARNEYSTALPDGTDLGLSAGDEYGEQAGDCVTG